MKIKINKSILDVTKWKPPTRRAGTLKLDLNENVIDFPIDLSMIIRNGAISSYPEYDVLLEKLSEYIGLSAGHLTLTNGADQAIDLIIKTLFQRGDRVVIPSPTFSYYYHVLKLNSVDYDPVCYARSDDRFDFPFTEVMNKIVSAAGLILTNPSNPVGSLICDGQLEAMISKCEYYNIPCIIDEAYFEYSDSSIFKKIEYYECLIIIRSFSKYFGLAGLRLGYVISNSSVRHALQSVRGPWDVNSLAVFMGVWCLDNIKFFINRHHVYVYYKNIIERTLRNNGIVVSQSKANFILASDASRSLFKEFYENDVMVSDLTGYPESNGSLVNYVRIGVPAKSADVHKLISIIEGLPAGVEKILQEH